MLHIKTKILRNYSQHNYILGKTSPAFFKKTARQIENKILPTVFNHVNVPRYATRAEPIIADWWIRVPDAAECAEATKAGLRDFDARGVARLYISQVYKRAAVIDQNLS